MDHVPSRSLSPQLAASIASHDLFQTLEENALAALVAELEVVHVPGGDILFKQGDAGDSMYLLNRGTLRVTTRNPDSSETLLDVLDSGTSVGEMALLTGQPRTATVTALNDAELIKLSKPAFDRLMAQHPPVMTAWARTMLPRWQRSQLAGVLTSLFGKLDGPALHDLQAALQWQHLSSGEKLFEQGEPGDALFIVVNGRLRFVARADDGTEQVVDEVTRGETVGEFALLTGKPRSATVYATRDSDVVKLDQATFERLNDRYPHAMLQIARMVAQRTQRTLEAARGLQRRAATFALIPISGGVDLQRLGERIGEVLASFGPTLNLSSTEIDRVLEKPGAAQTSRDDPTDVALVGWLTEQELQHEHLIFQADPGWSPWTQRCVRQADKILLVADADGDPTPGAIETALAQLSTHSRVELVLVQPPDRARPRGTLRWLAPRQVATHYHVRPGNDGDIQHLARRVSDRAVGLALSGGGARGFAHVGVLRALADAGVEIDVIGGSSMGALIGAVAAMGRDYTEAYKLAQSFASPKQLLDRTLPFASMMASAKVTQVLRSLFDDVQIEDLWRPFFCVSSNLTRAEPVVHRQGPLWAAVRASTAIPGIFSPMLLNGDVLVDGAVMNHFPIDLLRQEIPGGTLIASNASPRSEKLKNYQFGPSISGWQVLWSKINPFRRSMRVPSIFHILVRSTEIDSIYRLPSIVHLADVVIEPPVERFRTLDFAAYDAIINVGYQAAREKLARWRQAANTSMEEQAVAVGSEDQARREPETATVRQ